MRRVFGMLCLSGVLSVNGLAQGNAVRAPLVVTLPDKQFDSVAMRRGEGYLRVIVRSLDDPTYLLDGVRMSATPLVGDTAPTKRTTRMGNAQGLVDFGSLAEGGYWVEASRIGSQPVALRLRLRPGCHTVVEIYLTYQRRQSDVTLDAPTEPRATITTCAEG